MAKKKYRVPVKDIRSLGLAGAARQAVIREANATRKTFRDAYSDAAQPYRGLMNSANVLSEQEETVSSEPSGISVSEAQPVPAADPMPTLPAKRTGVEGGYDPAMRSKNDPSYDPVADINKWRIESGYGDIPLNDKAYERFFADRRAGKIGQSGLTAAQGVKETGDFINKLGVDSVQQTGGIEYPGGNGVRGTYKIAVTNPYVPRAQRASNRRAAIDQAVAAVPDAPAQEAPKAGVQTTPPAAANNQTKPQVSQDVMEKLDAIRDAIAAGSMPKSMRGQSTYMRVSNGGSWNPNGSYSKAQDRAGLSRTAPQLEWLRTWRTGSNPNAKSVAMPTGNAGVMAMPRFDDWRA